jgi:amidase
MALDFLQHDALDVAELVRRKEISPREAVEASIARIESANPRLNAVVHRMFDRALREAEDDIPDGPFRGVPFLLKDLLDWYEGEPITSGSRLFRGWIAPGDAEITRRYKRAGLIVVGKTNTPEFGLVPFTDPSCQASAAIPGIRMLRPAARQVDQQPQSPAEWCPLPAEAMAADRFAFLLRAAAFSG